MNKKEKVIKAWGGFVGGELDCTFDYRIFVTKRDARELGLYRDIRPVEIRVIEKKK